MPSINGRMGYLAVAHTQADLQHQKKTAFGKHKKKLRPPEALAGGALTRR